jgi:hypothetical protein
MDERNRTEEGKTDHEEQKNPSEGEILPHYYIAALWPIQPPIQRVSGVFPAGKVARAWL